MAKHVELRFDARLSFPAADRVACPRLLDLGPVEADEMAFAMTVFVESAHGNLSHPGQSTGESSAATFREARAESRELLQRLSGEGDSETAGDRPGRGGEVSLEVAFHGLWQHYEGDRRRDSLCARVLGFHRLMVRSQGAAMARWTEESPDTPESVVLARPVIQALASMPLRPSGGLPEALFLLTIEAFAVDTAFLEPPAS